MKLFRDNIFHENRVKKISYELDISEDIVEETVGIMYDYIRLKLDNIKVEDENVLMNEEEFDKTFPTIHIPNLGYFKPNYRKYKHMMKHKLKHAKNRKKNRK